jgi:hypothetical protein
MKFSTFMTEMRGGAKILTLRKGLLETASPASPHPEPYRMNREEVPLLGAMRITRNRSQLPTPNDTTSNVSKKEADDTPTGKWRNSSAVSFTP